MRNLRELIRQKRSNLWKNKIWLLHHDNVSAHTSLLVRDFLAKNNAIMLPQPPYSADLTPRLLLFPKLKRQKSKMSQNTSKQINCQKLTERSKRPNLPGRVRDMSTNITPQKIKNRIYVNHENTKFAIIFEPTTYSITVKLFHLHEFYKTFK